MAQIELQSPLEFEWQEAFMIPPEGEKLPWDRVPWEELTDEQKEAKTRFERFQREQQQEREEQRSRQDDPTSERRIPRL